MKYVRTSHYVEKSYEGKPSFVIILDDNGVEKSFISNGCQFKELTDDNIKKLISEYNCESYIQELLDNSIESDSCITDASYMLENGEQITEVNLSLPEAIYCSWLLYGCYSLTEVNLSLPLATDCSDLLSYCSSLTEVNLSLPKAKHYESLLYGCHSLIEVNLSLPQATDCYSLLSGCSFNKDNINFTLV